MVDASRRMPSYDEQVRRRRIVIGAGIGTAIEYYDFTIYAFLGTPLAAVFFPAKDQTAGLLSLFAVFAVSFFLRPIGGLVIGHLADRLGRRRALTVTVAGMILASFLIGFIPRYASIGLAAPIALVLLRSVQGLSAGGELGTATSYVAEQAPAGRRGYLTGFVNLGTLSGALFGSLTVALLRLGLDETQIVEWAWRIPFLLSLPLGLIGVIARRRMEESSAFEEIAREHDVKRAPLVTLLTRQPRGVLMVLALGLTSNAGYWMVFTYLGTYLQTQHVLSPAAASWGTTVSLILGGVTMPIWSRLSDRFDRRPVMVSINALFLISAYPLFVFAVRDAATAIFVQLVFGQLVTCYMANLLATLSEQLPASTRVSGIALGYNLASIIAGGSANFVAIWLVANTGMAASPAFFLMAASGVAMVASFALRKTANRPLLLD